MSRYLKVSQEDELTHWGVLGMKWGVRRYQNKDGSLTPKGKQKYQAKETDSSVTKRVKKDLSEMTGKEFKEKYQVSNSRYMKRVDKYIDPYMNAPLAKFGKKLEKKNKEKVDKLAKKYSDKKVVVEQIGKNKVRISVDGETWVSTGTAEKYKNKEKTKTSTKPKSTPKPANSKPDLTQRFNNAKAKTPNLDYNTIYKSDVGKKVMDKWQAKGLDRNTILEDPSYYKEVEDLWLKKQGF